MIEDSDMSGAWKEYRRAQQQRRATRLPARQQEIRELKAKGYRVVEKNEGYQFRIDGTLDLYPIHRRYHDLKTNTRGAYRDPLECAVRFLRGGRA